MSANPTTTMYTCAGYQDVRNYSEKRVNFPIHTSEIPVGHAHAVMSFTNARNESLEELIEGLKRAAGVTTLRHELV